MVWIFRIIALLEGVSYLLLFTLSMPLKYWAGIGEPNKYIGYAHGFLFLAFLLIAISLTIEKKWGIKRFSIYFLASLLPFGTFYIDKKYLKPLTLR